MFAFLASTELANPQKNLNPTYLLRSQYAFCVYQVFNKYLLMKTYINIYVQQRTAILTYYIPDLLHKEGYYQFSC